MKLLSQIKTITYEREFEFQVDDMEPQVACPHNVDNVKPISSVEGTTINQAFIGSCTNGRLEDLVQAGEVLRGKKVHEDVRLIIIPASAEIYRKALHNGLIDIFMDSGAIICNPGCGPCLRRSYGCSWVTRSMHSNHQQKFPGKDGRS